MSRKISVNELKNIILKEAKKVTTDISIAHDTVSDVSAQEDAWSGGANIHNNVDWIKSQGVKEGARKVGILEIRKMIKEEGANLAGKGKAAPYGSGWDPMKLDADKKKLMGQKSSKKN